MYIYLWKRIRLQRQRCVPPSLIVLHQRRRSRRSPHGSAPAACTPQSLPPRYSLWTTAAAYADCSQLVVILSAEAYMNFVTTAQTCREAGHELSRLTATKRWWRCDSCSHHFTTVGVRYPASRCPK